MNEYLDSMFPDKDHLRHFPDDANSDSPESSTFRIRVRPAVFLIGIGMGMALCCLIAVGIMVIILSGCKASDPPCVYDAQWHMKQPCVITAETYESEKKFQAVVKARQQELLKKQHGDVSQKMRDYRVP